MRGLRALQINTRIVTWAISGAFLFVQSGFSATPHEEELSFRLYRKLLQSQGSDNFVFSPYAIRQALGVTALGARGKTQKELGKIPEQLPGNKNSSYKLFLANRLWIQNGFPLLDSYQSASDRAFGLRPWIVDFSRAPDFLRDRVNGWVEEKTSGKIREFISDGFVDSSMRMLLGSALYFKGDWITPFDQKMTAEKSFILKDGEEIKVPFVQVKGAFNYLSLKDLQILELPFLDGEFSMVIFLPSPGKALARLEESISGESVERWLSDLSTKQVKVSLPRFTVESKLELTEPLRAMGIIEAFDPKQADFSGMTGKKNLFLSRFQHMALMSLTESGTEAAGISLSPDSRKPASVHVSFEANHPFLFGIRYRNPHGFLLQGRVNKPVFMNNVTPGLK